MARDTLMQSQKIQKNLDPQLGLQINSCFYSSQGNLLNRSFGFVFFSKQEVGMHAKASWKMTLWKVRAFVMDKNEQVGLVGATQLFSKAILVVSLIGSNSHTGSNGVKVATCKENITAWRSPVRHQKARI